MCRKVARLGTVGDGGTVTRGSLACCALVLACAGCSEAVDRRPQPRQATRSTLFGAPELVPTREGERIRRELATAAEIRQTLAGFLPWRIHHVQVRLSHEGVRGRVSVVLQVNPDAAEVEPYVDQIQRIVAGIVPETGWRAEQTTVVVGASERDIPGPREPFRPRDILLVLSIFGFGASFGVVVDRSLLRRQRSENHIH